MLTIFYVLSMLDRGIFAILAEDIKRDLGLTDGQVGLLGGLGFTLFYGGLSIPVARLAERFKRISLISGALMFWSGATMASGAAWSFVQMLLTRAAVGAGEAACHPCAHSLIADSYPPSRRASAASLFSLAIPIGTFLGLLGGAILSHSFGWRWAFVIVGAPGILVAAIAWATLREPPRGAFDAHSTDQPPSYAAVLRHLFSRKSFILLAAGWILTTAAWSGGASFMAPYLARAPYGLSIGEIGTILGLLAGFGSLIGTVGGGFVADRFSRGDTRIYLLVPAASLFITGPAFAIALFQDTVTGFILFAAIGNIFMLAYTGPSWGTVHNLVESRMRASAVATLSVLVAVIGAGAGPVLTGFVSDALAHSAYGADFAAQCAGDPSSLSQACRTASFEGLRRALMITVMLHVAAGLLYWRGSHFIRNDIPRPTAGHASAAGQATS